MARAEQGRDGLEFIAGCTVELEVEPRWGVGNDFAGMRFPHWDRIEDVISFGFQDGEVLRLDVID